MPNNGIAKILSDKTPHPSEGNGIPRCELYFYVENIEAEFENATQIGAKLISEIKDRDWGDKVCYFADQMPITRTQDLFKRLKDKTTFL